jgi:hypothetical protein
MMTVQLNKRSHLLLWNGQQITHNTWFQQQQICIQQERLYWKQCFLFCLICGYIASMN